MPSAPRAETQASYVLVFGLGVEGSCVQVLIVERARVVSGGGATWSGPQGTVADGGSASEI